MTMDPFLVPGHQSRAPIRPVTTRSAACNHAAPCTPASSQRGYDFHYTYINVPAGGVEPHRITCRSRAANRPSSRIAGAVRQPDFYDLCSRGGSISSIWLRSDRRRGPHQVSTIGRGRNRRTAAGRRRRAVMLPRRSALRPGAPSIVRALVKHLDIVTAAGNMAAVHAAAYPSARRRPRALPLLVERHHDVETIRGLTVSSSRQPAQHHCAPTAESGSAREARSRRPLRGGSERRTDRSARIAGKAVAGLRFAVASQGGAHSRALVSVGVVLAVLPLHCSRSRNGETDTRHKTVRRGAASMRYFARTPRKWAESMKSTFVIDNARARTHDAMEMTANSRRPAPRVTGTTGPVSKNMVVYPSCQHSLRDLYRSSRGVGNQHFPVQPSVPARNGRSDLLARTRAGQLTYSSFALRAPRISERTLAMMTAQARALPYKGSAQAVAALLRRSQVQLRSMQPRCRNRAHRLRPLRQRTARRSPAAPEYRLSRNPAGRDSRSARGTGCSHPHHAARDRRTPPLRVVRP